MALVLFPPPRSAWLPCWYCSRYGIRKYQDREASNDITFLL